MPFPYGPSIHFFLSIAESSAAGDTSGCAIEAAASGKGVEIFRIEAADDIGFKLTSAAILDSDLNVVTPLLVSSPSPVLTTVIRTGREAAGLLPSGADYIWDAGLNPPAFALGGGIFVPPGMILTLLRTSTNAAFAGNFGLSEYLAFS